MFKVMALLFVVIAPTLAGILIVGILSMSSPTAGGTPLSEQGMTILLVSVAAAVAALPISYVVAGMVNKAIKS